MSVVYNEHFLALHFLKTAIFFNSQGVDEEGGTTDTATTENSARHDKDSGVGRTDESCKNDESSEQVNPSQNYHML